MADLFQLRFKNFGFSIWTWASETLYQFLKDLKVGVHPILSKILRKKIIFERQQP